MNSFPVPDTDVDRAVRFVKAHATTWNLDPRHVSCSPAPPPAATSPHWPPPRRASSSTPTLPADLAAVSPRVQGVLDFVGVSDFSTFGAAGGWAPGLMTAFLDCPVTQIDLCDPAKVAAASVAPHLDATAPPAFLAYGAHRRPRGVDDPGPPPRPRLDPRTRRRRSRTDLDRGVSFQQTAGGHNIDSTELNVDEMQTWIAAVILSPPPATTVAARPGQR